MKRFKNILKVYTFCGHGFIPIYYKGNMFLLLLKKSFRYTTGKKIFWRQNKTYPTVFYVDINVILGGKSSRICYFMNNYRGSTKRKIFAKKKLKVN